MKTRLVKLCFVAVLISLVVGPALVISGCHSFPKDSYGQDVKSTINTPWGSVHP